MGFGPFLSKEEKARINGAYQSNYGSKPTPPTGNLGVGVGPFVSPAQKTQINTALQQNHGPKYGPPIPKVKVPTGGRSAIKAEERRRNIENAKTPYVPPAPTPSTSSRKGGVARPTGGIQIGVPQSSPISTQRPNRSSSTTTETPSSSLKVEDKKTGSVKKPSAFPTEAVLQTIKPSRDYQKEASIDLPTDDRNSTRTDARGNIQTGTITGPKPMTMDDANKLLSDGYKINTRYASNQLPYTQTSPYAGKGNAEIYNQETLLQHQQGPGSPDYVSLSKDLFGDRSGVATYERGKNMNADYKQMDVNPGEKVPEEKVNWANRTMADNSDAKIARRRAFLDAKGTMQGLRDSEAVQGISYRGGNHYIADGKGGDSLTKVENKDDMRTYKSGEEGAREIRDKYVNALTSKDETPTPLPDSEQAAANVETSPNQKPLTVAPSDIPSDLSGTAGQEYLRKLDAGQFTRSR